MASQFASVIALFFLLTACDSRGNGRVARASDESGVVQTPAPTEVPFVLPPAHPDAGAHGHRQWKIRSDLRRDHRTDPTGIVGSGAGGTGGGTGGGGQPVPEPMTLLLVGSGLIGALGMHRRRRERLLAD